MFKLNVKTAVILILALLMLMGSSSFAADNKVLEEYDYAPVIGEFVYDAEYAEICEEKGRAAEAYYNAKISEDPRAKELLEVFGNIGKNKKESSTNRFKSKLPKLDKSIEEYIRKELEKAYDEYYVLSNITISINNIEEDKNKVIYFVGVNFYRTLKVKDASELPYLKGIEEVLKETKDENKVILEYYNSKLKDVNDNYIGIPQETNDTFKIITAKANGELDKSQIEMRIYDEINKDIVYEASMEEYGPKSFEYIKSEGKASARQFNVANKKEIHSSLRASAQDYDRIRARNYILAWTDNCEGCHCKQCDPQVSVYNSNYNSYHWNDCTNYVSQAIHAGGIASDSQWTPSQYAWINDTGLSNYMVGNGYFFESTDRYKAFAGSLVRWVGDHIVMVDKNDTAVMTYCGHTKDRVSFSFKDIYNVKFYIPVWDSYANQWTPR